MVDKMVEPCVNEALKTLQKWDVSFSTKNVAKSDFIQPELNKKKYENERPSEEDAIRMGDERVLAQLDDVYKLRDRPLFEGIGNVKSVPVDGRKLFEEQ